MLVRQAANVLELLEFFARHKQPATMAEISDLLEWPRSSTFNLVGTLAERGYLYEPRQRGGYYPSPRWASTLNEITAADPLPQPLIDTVAAIAARTGETTALGQAAGTHVVFLHVCESRQPIRYFAQVGTRVPIQASSAGRAILAQLSARDREVLYRRIEFSTFSDTTPTDAQAVEDALAEAEKRGHHQSNSEYIPDLAGVALPVSIESRKLSIVVAGPTSRCLARQQETADTIRQEMKARKLG